MAPVVVELNDESFFSFVAQREPTVVFLSVHPVHGFGDTLRQELAQSVPVITFGTLTITDLALPGSPALNFLAQARTPGSRFPSAGPGYYLFRESELLAYDLGLPRRTEMPNLFRHVALAAAWHGLLGEPSRFARSVIGAAEKICGPRIARQFSAVLSETRYRERSAPAEAPSATEVTWAYKLLGVRESDDDVAVNAAWRRLRAANHPDHAGGDPREFERRTRVSQQLNRARDVILATRTRARAA